MRTELLGLLGAALLLAPVAHAEEPGLELSRDGRTWSPSLSGPLLDEDARIVPGGATRADLWVRNSTGHRTTMSVLTRGISSSLPEDVAPRDDFRVTVDGTRVPGSSTRGCRVFTTRPLDPGERQRVPVSVGLPGSSRNISQDASVRLSMRVNLVAGEAGNPCTGETPGPGDDPDSEPDVPGGDDGAAAPVPEAPGQVATDGGPGEGPARTDLVLVGLGLLAAAAAHTVRRRGRERRERRAS